MDSDPKFCPASFFAGVLLSSIIVFFATGIISDVSWQAYTIRYGVAEYSRETGGWRLKPEFTKKEKVCTE